MACSSLRLFIALHATALVALSACEKKPPPPPVELPPPPPSVDAGVVQITPFDDSLDSGVDAAPVKPHAAGPAINANAARIRQCCNAIRHEAKNLGTSPEATMIIGLAAQCDLIATQVTSSGTAPEFAQVRALLKGRTIPAACAGM
jgi:hypothetical protein